VKKVIDDTSQVPFIREATVAGIINLDSKDEACKLSPTRVPDDEASDDEPSDPIIHLHVS
jgi:hypothetical protein